MSARPTSEASKRKAEARAAAAYKESLEEDGLDTNDLDVAVSQDDTSQAGSASSTGAARVVYITVRVGPKVARYTVERDVWQRFINEQAFRDMRAEDFIATDSVRGMLKRTMAILSTNLHRLNIPKEVIESLERDITLRQEVGLEYLMEEANARNHAGADPDSPLAIKNRQHNFFRKMQGQILDQLRAYAFMTS